MPCQHPICEQHLSTISRPDLRSRRGSTPPQRHGFEGACTKRAVALGKLSLLVGLFSVVGCASPYIPPMLTLRHPAHPEAVSGPALPPSTTLAYTPADMPSPRPAVARSGPSAPESSASAQPRSQTVVGEGRVIAVVPASGEIVLSHGEIKGFMEAMTMGYQIQPPSLLEEVQAGDTVRFTIDTAQKAIVAIEKLN
jgi:Cu(I)/Ag(I) efflux system protein CusF